MRDFLCFGRYHKGRALRYIFLNVIARSKRRGYLFILYLKANIVLANFKKDATAIPNAIVC